MRDEAIAVAAAAALPLSALVSRRLVRLRPRIDQAVSSFAGGVAIAFVLLQLLVELITDVSGGLHAAVPLGDAPIHTLVLVVLAGMTVFCIAHAYANRGPESNRTYAALAVPYGIYSVLVGAALVEEAHHGPKTLLLYVLAMALHLGVGDQHLVAHFPREHRGWVRALIMVAPVLGTLGWLVLEPPAPVFDVALALVAGATLLNAIREELPAPADMRSWAFLAGVVLYGALIEVRVRL